MEALAKSECKHFTPTFEKTMVLIKTDENEVQILMRELKNRKRSGHDGISKEILKCCSPILENFLVKSFNICLEERKVPQFMKIAKGIPPFKKRARIVPKIIRPFSRLTSVSEFSKNCCINEWYVFSRRTNCFDQCSLA